MLNSWGDKTPHILIATKPMSKHDRPLALSDRSDVIPSQNILSHLKIGSHRVPNLNLE
jgi:hypothetical protein